jgi:hypothetical protein
MGKITREKNFPSISDEEMIVKIEEITDRLDEDEQVIMLSTQTRNPLKLGSSLFTPNTVFATNKKIIIRNPTALGYRHYIESYSYDQIIDAKLEKGMFSSTISINVAGSVHDGWIEAIPKEDAEKLLKIIFDNMQLKKNSSSEDDPLIILKKRFAKGEISKEEYQEMKSMLE